MTEHRRPMVVAAFLDGRPGHEKQTRGILMELGAMVDLEVVEIRVGRRSLPGMIGDLLKLFIGSGNAEGMEGYRHVDLLLGAGSQTHVPMLRMKRTLAIPAVVSMMPAPYLRSFFDLCCVPLHDGVAEGGNVMTTVGPPNCSRPQGEKCQSAGLILLGGIDRKSHIWKSREAAEQILTITEREPDVHWTVSSSPRTPPDMVEMVVNIATERSNVEFFRFEETASGWIEQQYARSRIVWVTADSMSMVYEALSAGCQVGILPVCWKRAENKFKRSAEYLAAHGLALAYPSWLEKGEVDWQGHEPLNEAKRCAAEIMRRWPRKD